MKDYWSIPGPSKAPQSHCIAFYKYDGSNFRAEWSKKKGWYKFGTRNRAGMDGTDPLFGPAIKVFLDTYGDDLPKVIRDNKEYRGVDRASAFCEYFGPSSIGLWHDWDELHSVGEVMLFDVNIHRRGFVLPRDFVKNFGHLKIAEVIYEGNFNKKFRQDVWEGKYSVREGIVAKGVLSRKRGRPEHGLWMSKVKTQWWFDEVRRKYKETNSEEYRRKWKQLLEDNEKEQCLADSGF